MAKKRSKTSESIQVGAAPSSRKAELISVTGKMSKPLRLGEDCDYNQELGRLQIELVKLHEWIRYSAVSI